jgi:hypothetical protein
MTGRLAYEFNDNARSAQRAQPLPRERLRNLAGRLHGLGARPLFEFLREIAAGADLHEHLERYCELAPLTDFIAEWGDDRGVTHIRPLRAEPNPDPYYRVLRILRWVSEVASVELIEDPLLLAALGEFEHALVAYLDTRP